tara:strand:+ start:457 stop:837 length:381 start_codon:yes stop_codon:yes gene_type:complete
MLNKRQQNKIRTPGYFIKRLRDNGYCVVRIFQEYAISDPRRWTVMVNPKSASVFITCYQNREFNNQIMFEFNDGGILFPRNYSIQTESIEVIISNLVKRNIQTITKDDELYVEKTQAPQQTEPVIS